MSRLILGVRTNYMSAHKQRLRIKVELDDMNEFSCEFGLNKPCLLVFLILRETERKHPLETEHNSQACDH